MTKNRVKPAAVHRRQQPKRALPWPVWLGVGGLLLVLAGIFVLARPNTSSGSAANISANQAPSGAQQATGGPKLAVDRDKIDFGTVPLNKPVEAAFKLTNAGDKPLQIEGKPTIDVQKGC